jgi:hypothetical protein
MYRKVVNSTETLQGLHKCQSGNLQQHDRSLEDPAAAMSRIRAWQPGMPAD